MQEELGHPVPDNGYLMPWAEQGVLLLNAVLTVRAGEANSHKGKGWEKFTDAVIRAVADRPDPAVFVLWGNYAQKKLPLIDEERHVVVKGAHPSPLSAKKFFGSRPFTPDQRGGRGAGPRPRSTGASPTSVAEARVPERDTGPARPPVPGGFRPGTGSGAVRAPERDCRCLRLASWTDGSSPGVPGEQEESRDGSAAGGVAGRDHGPDRSGDHAAPRGRPGGGP